MDSKSSLSWLGIQDYFNYYLPGLIWIGNFALIIALIDESQLVALLNTLGQTEVLILIGTAILIPYLTGLMLNSVGFIVSRIDKTLFGRPEVYVLDPTQKKTILNFKFGSSLGRELRQNVIKLASEKLNTSQKSSSLFSNVRYSLQIAPYSRIQSHVARLTNLINLHEGLIVPMLLGIILLLITPNALLLSSKVLALLLFIATISVWKKYHYLRELRVKQVFRYFYLWQTFGGKLKSENG